MRRVSEQPDLHRRFSSTDWPSASFWNRRADIELRAAGRPRSRGHRPVVVADANALISDVVRRIGNRPTLMPYLAERNLIRLVTAAHVDDTVYAGLHEACAHTRCDLQAAIEIYETAYRPRRDSSMPVI